MRTAAERYEWLATYAIEVRIDRSLIGRMPTEIEYISPTTGSHGCYSEGNTLSEAVDKAMDSHKRVSG